MAKSGAANRRASKSRKGSRKRRRGNNLLRWAGVVGALAVVAVAVIGLIGSGRVSLGGGPSEDSTSADLAADFGIDLYQGEDKLGGEKLNFSALRGKPVVLNFWAGLCPPCRAEMPDFQEFYEETRDDVTLLGVDIGRFTGLGSQDDARALLEELAVTYPAGSTGDGSVVRDFQVLGMPTTVFINSKGEIFEVWNGALNKEVLGRVTDAMLKEEGAVTSSVREAN